MSSNYDKEVRDELMKIVESEEKYKEVISELAKPKNIAALVALKYTLYDNELDERNNRAYVERLLKNASRKKSYKASVMSSIIILTDFIRKVNKIPYEGDDNHEAIKEGNGNPEEEITEGTNDKSE